MMRLRALPVFGLIALAGCAHAPAKVEPIKPVIEVGIPVATGCVPPTLGPAPDLPGGTGPVPNGATGPQRYQNSLADRKLLLSRNKELETVVAGCPKAEVGK